MAASINQLGFVIFAMILVSCSISAMADSESAFIVAHKKATLTKLTNGVERIFVSIDLYNRGSLTVYDVSLVDKSWPVDSFDLVSGNFSRSWDSLDAGAIVSHSIELEPRVKGLFQGSPAVITFRIPNKAAPVVAYSTPIYPLNMLADTTPENKLELAKSLLARFGAQFSAVSLVALFGYMIATPKSNAAKAQKKRR
ncbi:translocon-associated protein subunit beta-like [Chenopodium quinoa]|uniref:translocon-associated protein subunit beta-like n=1 Tax=Chenopodium quinoa TaxID=63459 RepID=UPI000B774F8C|nr:translocon-associated protein subunit beta-like [Chenopodium quinoa]